MKTNPQKGAYPTWSDLLAILGLYLVAMLAFNLGGGLLLRFGIASQGPVVALVYALTFLSTICYALFAKRLRVGPDEKLLRFGFRKTDPALVLWGVITVLATTLVIEPLLELFPSRWLEWLGDQMKLGGWMMLTTVVVAPILEEILFRGILQESLTRKYGPWRGILIASAIFGIVHGIPQQALNAFFVGAMIGFIYYKTQSLIPCILIHALNNAVAYLALATGHGNALLIDLVGSRTLYVLIYIAALALSAVSGYMMLRTLRRMKEAEKNPSAA